jgi:hypothetical protein
MEGERGRWWPFRPDELQTVLGLVGFATTCLALGGLPPAMIAWGSVVVVVLAYIAALLVRAREAATALKILPNGALAGAGHMATFHSVRRALLLMHLDDDPPNEQLLAMYRRLLDRGVEIRRIVFLRPEAAPNAYSWIAEFGDHHRLQHRVVLPDESLPVRFSFSVVDTSTVLLSIPGWDPVDGAAYSTHLVLRHLLAVSDPQVVAVFARMHEEMWDRALPIRSAAEFADPAALAQAAAVSGRGPRKADPAA